MSAMFTAPSFGQADLSNCERELIHLAGSIQPHGVLLVLDESNLKVLQTSDNVGALLDVPANQLLDKPVGLLRGDIEDRIRSLIQSRNLKQPTPLRCYTSRGGQRRDLEGAAHRHSGGGIIVELEPLPASVAAAQCVEMSAQLRQRHLTAAVQSFSGALSIPSLSDAVVQCFREMSGYDRVMVYKFDPDGHGEIIAEARDPRLESLLGHHYPASDIPQRARELYVRNRARVLVDVNYAPAAIVPRRCPVTQDDLDMSLCNLRSMSPLHLQYLRNMGVTATLVVSLVREERLWGLIACHHYSSRHVNYAMRAASELLAEVIATRIAAIENYVQAQVEVLVRRLELRLIEATSTDGDWRLALFRNPRTLLQPLDASGAALYYDGSFMTAGEVPSTPELRALVQWIAGQSVDSLFSCSSVARAHPALSSLTPTASGVLALALSPSRADYLMWFRKEQLSEVTWAGDPAKPMLENDPHTLSPRRSFAAWVEIVRGTATPWSRAETVLARAIGMSVADIILQIQAVRLLIAQHQLAQVRVGLVNSKEPVVIADANGRILFSNESFSRLFRRPAIHLEHLDDLAALFTERIAVRAMFDTLKTERTPWRGELSLVVNESEALPVGVRADVVSGRSGTVLGIIVNLTDLTDRKKAEAARRHFENSISQAQRAEALRQPGSQLPREPDEVMSAILANANVAAMEIADAAGETSVVPLLEELEASTQRAAALYQQLRAYARRE